MADPQPAGWRALLEENPGLDGSARFPLAAYSEFLPPPRLGRRPYGALDIGLFPESDSSGWRITEAEEEWELQPGLRKLADCILEALVKLGRGEPSFAISGHQNRNLRENPYWPPELAGQAGRLLHERYCVLLPLALSRTQDDQGRIRWTFFGGSEQGPEKAFWKSFFSTPDGAHAETELQDFFIHLIRDAYDLPVSSAADLRGAGFRILPADFAGSFSYWHSVSLPEGTRPFLLSDPADWESVRFLFTFQPFAHLPAPARQRYLSGKMHLLPFPGSLVFWGMPTYLRLAAQLQMAAQIPLLRVAPRSGGPDGIRIPQSGWLHEARPGFDSAAMTSELLAHQYQRTNRWSRTHRYENELESNPHADHITRVLFDTSLEALDLYNKPMARNSQLWTAGFDLLLDGPRADRTALRLAEEALAAGGLFGYRFYFPAMRVGSFDLFWHRPLAAFSSPETGRVHMISPAPLGYITAYRAEADDLSDPIELWPRLLRRAPFLEAVSAFGRSDHFSRQTAHNLLSLLDTWQMLGEKPLSPSFARHLVLTAKEESLEDWLHSLPERAFSIGQGQTMRSYLAERILPPAEPLPTPVTFGSTAARAFEEAYWNDIVWLSNGRYRTTDNADVVRDEATQKRLIHHHRDLEKLGDDLLRRHQASITAAGMEERSICGALPFRWETDFNFPDYGGWRANQEGRAAERNLLVVIPGRNRSEAVVLADHYDTAYMEDVFDRARGGSGARLAAAGADDNHSATATLLQAAPLFLRMSCAGQLERDIWLLHLTGEEFPSDCLGARAFCRALMEHSLHLELANRTQQDLSAVRVAGVLLMDMIAHNRAGTQDIFQIAPGRGRESLQLAQEAHTVNMLWNANARAWNAQADRSGAARGIRSRDGATIPPIARHPSLHGEIRTIDQPQSSLYNTDGQIFSDVGIPVILFMEDYDINRTGYHDSLDTPANIDLDYGCAVAAIVIETAARLAMRSGL